MIRRDPEPSRNVRPTRARVIASWLVAATVLAPGLLGALEEAESRTESWRVDDPASEALVLDTIEGSIRVRGVDGNEIRVLVEKLLVAPTREEMDEIERKMPLRIDRRPGVVELLVEAPWRDERRWRGDDHWRNPGRLRYDFTAEIPRGMSVVLKTVNDGEIRVDDVLGGFEVRNVNGGVRLQGLGSAGSAKTVNGGLVARFARPPENDCEFSTVNGTIDVTFPGDFGADVHVKTLNGEVYTAFDYELGAVQTSTSRRGDRYQGKISRVVRLNGGGPTVRFQTINGDVEIRKGS